MREYLADNKDKEASLLLLLCDNSDPLKEGNSNIKRALVISRRSNKKWLLHERTTISKELLSTRQYFSLLEGNFRRRSLLSVH